MFSKPHKRRHAALIWSSTAFLTLVTSITLYVLRSHPTMSHTGSFHVRDIYPIAPRYAGGPASTDEIDNIWETYELKNPWSQSIWIVATEAGSTCPSVPYLEFRATNPPPEYKRSWESNAGCTSSSYKSVEVPAGGTVTLGIPSRFKGTSRAIKAIRVPFNFSAKHPGTYGSPIFQKLNRVLFEQSSDGCIHVPLRPELASIPKKPDLLVHHTR